MTQKNILISAPPLAVMESLTRLGDNLKTARLRRNLSLKSVSEKIGAGIKVIRDAEQGKSTTSVVVYMALLWTYGLLESADDLANPFKDEIGLRLLKAKQPQRSKPRKISDNNAH